LEPDNEVTRRLVVRLQAGVRSRIQPRQAPLGLTASKPLDLGVDLTAGRARRALFLAETATDAGRAAALAELDRVLADDPTLAYARYAAQRAGVHVPGARPDTTFAFAFAQAAREGATAAFEALAQHVFGMERYVARAGITLLSDAVTFATPPGANDLEPAALARRFTVLTGEITTALRGPSADRRIFLRLLGDFAAADLSSGIVA
jgi:hypothetical protein